MRTRALLAVLVLAAGCGSSGSPGATGGPSGAPSTPPVTSASPTPAPTPSSSPSLLPTATRRPSPPAPTAKPAPTPKPTTLACAGVDREVLPGAGRAVALTFDLGGNDAGIAAILRTLSSERVRATFFVTGAWARAYPTRVREIAAAGHVLGNHTDTHPHLPALTDDQVRAQLRAGEAAVAPLAGRTTKPLFRFPFGDGDSRTLRLVNAGGWCAYRWTVDTLGWKGTSGGTAADVRSRVLGHLQPGEIVLMHGGGNPDDGTTYDADALPSIIDALRDRGYGFVALPR